MEEIIYGDFQNIPILKSFEDYAIETHKDSGNKIPVSRLEHWDDFLKFDFIKNRDYIYRGQTRGEWELKSSLTRLCCTPTDNELKEMLDEFRKALKEMNISIYKETNDFDLWCIARHHGLLSPILDWSYDPKIALFFAFELHDNKRGKDQYLAIYILNKQFIEENYSDDIHLRGGASSEKRVIAQKALFMQTKNCIQIEKILKNPDTYYKHFRKIYINTNEAKKCLSYLDKEQHISMKRLYPAHIEGAVRYSNLYFQKFYRQKMEGEGLTICKKVIDKDDRF